MSNLGIAARLAIAILMMSWALGYLFPHTRLGDRLAAACCILAAVGFIADAAAA